MATKASRREIGDPMNARVDRSHWAARNTAAAAAATLAITLGSFSPHRAESLHAQSRRSATARQHPCNPLRGSIPYIINKGDAITYQSTETHLISNRSEGTTVAIWINCPPSF